MKKFDYLVFILTFLKDTSTVKPVLTTTSEQGPPFNNGQPISRGMNLNNHFD
jgi:hypothetical protein